MVAGDVAIVGIGISRDGVASIGQDPDAIGFLILAGAQAFLPVDGPGAVGFYDPKIPVAVVAADVAVIGFGPSCHDISAVGGELEAIEVLVLRSAICFL